jgi:glycine reductase complex component B subunit alpha and beta
MNDMILEMSEYPVSRIKFGEQFSYRSGTLEVDRAALVQLILADQRIESADCEIVAPGERVRITGVRDIVEPRVKFGNGSQVFPGTLGPVIAIGAGKTHRLSGIAVVATAAYEGRVRAGTGVQRSGIIDMWGAGAEASRFSSRINLVLILRLKEGLAELEAHTAILQAELKAAQKLAEVTVGLKPAGLVTYDLGIQNEQLPRVVLIQGCITQSSQPHSGVAYYGLPIRDSLATWIHPNELLDGAVTTNTIRQVGYSPTTWDWQNHPLVERLGKAHFDGQINFAGVVIEKISYESYHAKEVTAHSTAQLAASLGADAALITWLGSGNAFVDVMLTIKACEQRGIKTVLVTYEYAGKDGVDSPLLYYAEQANAVVSTGSRDRWLTLPAADRVVGPYEQIRLLSYPGAPTMPAHGALTLDARDMIVGGVDIWGSESWTCVVY